MYVKPVPVTKEFKKAIQNYIGQNNFRISSQRISKGLSAACKDSSYKKLLNSGTLTYALYCSGKTADGGVILGGFGRNSPDPPPYVFYGMLVKIDSAGNFIWGRELRANGTGAITVQAVKEMADKTIIISGSFDNNGEENTMVAKLSATGNLIWIKTFKTISFLCGSSETFSITQIEEGNIGDVLLTGYVTGCFASYSSTVCKLNSSGNLQWSTFFQYPCNTGVAFGLTYDNGTVKLFSRFGTDYNCSEAPVVITKLDYSTGSVLSHKAWSTNLLYPASFWEGFSNSQQYVQKLNNGNYCVYGELNGDWIPVSGISHHFAVLEFNSNDDFIKGYLIESPLAANADGSSSIKMDARGRVLFSLFVNYTGTSLDIFMGSIDNGSILKLRQRHYGSSYFFGHDTWEFFSDNSYIFLKQLSDVDNTNERIEFSRLHDSDTSSDCLGIDSNFCFIRPTHYFPFSFNFTNVFSNALSETTNGGIIESPQFHTPVNICPQTSICDTVKIHGNVISCDLNQDFIYTAYKNQDCGSWVKWTIDTSAVTFLQQLNDTTLKIHFRSNWQGYLYADIPGNCGTVKDSLWISVFDSPGAVDLGPDTSLCPSNTILLNVHKGYVTYLWQDGSADSLFTVLQPGTYSVKVTDGCGNVFRDTIRVAPAPPIPFEIGPDRIKCNNDTLHLEAPPGFLNYTWSPPYNINSANSQNVVINPSIDTSYSVVAERTPGCFAYDTIHIGVHSSPTIDLGTDKSFCSGDSATLNAGPGFSQYQWSTGKTTQQITVNAKGSYSFIGTTAEGCRSYDTLEVVNVFPLPLVHLDHDSTLCAGDLRTLDAGPGFVSYLWNSGTTTSYIIANGVGLYSVMVTDDHGCTGSDTTTITTLIPLPSDFLPADTVICSYGKIELKPVHSFKEYLWSNNSRTPAITISQPGQFWLRVVDNNNCRGIDTVIVSIEDCMEGFYAPSAFTPNNDGKNDIFRPLIFGNVKKYQFTIYNRWGQIVFQTTEVGKGWDGKFGGMQQDPNVFVWMCIYQIEGEELKQEKGSVTLIR
jgi:gliding motility-associated-like protein